MSVAWASLPCSRLTSSWRIWIVAALVETWLVTSFPLDLLVRDLAVSRQRRHGVAEVRVQDVDDDASRHRRGPRRSPRHRRALDVPTVGGGQGGDVGQRRAEGVLSDPQVDGGRADDLWRDGEYGHPGKRAAIVGRRSRRGRTGGRGCGRARARRPTQWSRWSWASRRALGCAFVPDDDPEAALGSVGAEPVRRRAPDDSGGAERIPLIRWRPRAAPPTSTAMATTATMSFLGALDT